jgi:SAM-dependent methyltransferase
MLDDPGQLRLNLGAGKTYIPAFVNVDIDEKADVSLDLGREPLPFEDDSASLVFSHWTLEHIPDYLAALAEIHRVLRHDGVLLLGLPYVTLTEYHLVNPYHLHNFSEHSFDFFDPARLKGSAVERNSITFRTVFHRFHYMGRFGRLPEPMRRWARRHLFNVVKSFDVGLVALKHEGEVDTGAERAAELRQAFDRCVTARKRY